MFVNSREFDHPNSRQQAMGVDTRRAALYSAGGQALAHPQTGGMISPSRHELHTNDVLYRFASSESTLGRAVTGGWWVAREEFQQLSSFAQHNNLHIAMAARLLCCVPPEWSDMGLLLRAVVNQPLLAYRGLGNDVRVDHPDGLGAVHMQAHNHIASRRLYQLFIPGLVQYADKTPNQVLPGALTLEQEWRLDTEQARRGWLYI